ncbi:MAG TPA: DUF4340 domain-containing protein [Clostridia bacterium]|nr:DUF4340 domain-containing protein [Clostridia bacterium]
MRKSRNLIIVLVVLGVLAGSYFFLANRPEPEGPEEVEKISVLKLEKDEIQKMEIKNEFGELTFTRGEKEVEVEKDGKKEKEKKSVWEVDYPHEILLKEMRVDDLAYSFANLQAERIIEEETPDDLAPYGLKEPQATGTVTLKDGSKNILYLGNQTPIGNTYYLMLDGDPKVYEVWTNHGDHLRYTLADVRDKSLPQVNPEALSYLLVDKKDDRPIEIRLSEEDEEDAVQVNLGLWQMIRPYRETMNVNGEAVSKYLEAMPMLSIEDFVEDGAEDLSKYGLDEPKAEFIIKDDENSIHLLIGDEYDDGMVYFKLPDSNSVYGMKKANTKFLDVTAFELVDKFIYIVSIDNVDKIEVEGLGQKHTLTLERETKPAEEEDEEDEVVTTYRVDGKEVEDKPFKKVYQSVVGVLADSEVKPGAAGRPEIKATFHLNKGKNRQMLINYVPYDNDFYAVFIDGESEFAVNKPMVHQMLTDIGALYRGEFKVD